VRPFHIAAGATVTLKQLTITGGDADDSDGGGGVLNQGALTLNACIVTHNNASESGGGVANLAGGTLIVKSSTVSNNFTAEAGGGISNRDGILQLVDTKVKGNDAFSVGGLSNSGSSASATIQDCIIAGNIAAFGAGGISNSGSGQMSVERSTISGNSTQDEGAGGVSNSGTADFFNCTIAYNFSAFFEGVGGGFRQILGTLTIVNCTIVGNADTSNEAEGAGGIAKFGGTLIVRNSIIAGNFTGPDSADDNVDTMLLDENTSNFIGGDPRLGPLDFNGGLTQTMAPLAGSTLINAGSNTAANNAGLTTDQRGLTRIVNGDVDIGAVEIQAGEPLPQRAPYEHRESRDQRGTSFAGAFDIDLAFAAIFVNQDRGTKREAAARLAVFAEVGTTD
jgi:hypothetical protein